PEDGAEAVEVATEALLGHAVAGRGQGGRRGQAVVEEDVGEAGADGPAHVRQGPQGYFVAGIGESGDVEVWPGAQVRRAVVVDEGLLALGGQEAVREGELAKARGQAVADLEARRHGAVEVGLRDVARRQAARPRLGPGGDQRRRTGLER